MRRTWRTAHRRLREKTGVSLRGAIRQFWKEVAVRARATFQQEYGFSRNTASAARRHAPWEFHDRTSPLKAPNLCFSFEYLLRFPPVRRSHWGHTKGE